VSTSRPAVLDDQAVERLLTGRPGPAEPDLQQLLRVLRSTGSGPAPRPTAALAELLDAGFEPRVVPLRRRAVRRTWVLRATAGLTAAAASLLVAGTAQALPAPLQDGLGDLVSAITPFELPGARAADESSSRVPEPDAGTTTPEEPVPAPAPSAPGSMLPVPGAGADPAAPGTPASGAATTDGGGGEARGTGAPARTTVPDVSPPPSAPEQARSEPRRAAPEAPPSPREAAPSTAPRGTTVTPDPAGTGQGRTGSPDDASTAPEIRGTGGNER
jgi:hypothetical protein